MLCLINTVTFENSLFSKGGLLHPGGYEQVGKTFNDVYTTIMLFNSKDDKLSSFHNNARTHSADTEFSLVDDIDELRRDMVGCLINDRHVSLLKFGQRFEGQHLCIQRY